MGPAGLDRSGLAPRIIGGRPVPDGRYAFQAALLAQSFGNNDYQRQFCGGSLISPYHVLTAAHCVEFFGDGVEQVPLSDLRAVVGRTVLTSTQGQKRRAAGVDIHPRYDPVTASHDVAVVHLASPIFGIRPIMLATVTGWGNTIAQPVGPGGGGVNYPNRMRVARVPTRPPGAATSRSASPAGATVAARPGSPGVYARLSNRAVGNFVLEVTGAPPVTSARAA